MRRRAPGSPETTTDGRGARGLRAEAIAAEHLAAAGLVLLAARYRTRAGELDLVMRDARELVFVEVRSRGPRSAVDPVETVTARKRQRLARTAEAYLAAHPRDRSRPARFDVVGVAGDLARPEVTWIRRAFTLDDLQ